MFVSSSPLLICWMCFILASPYNGLPSASASSSSSSSASAPDPRTDFFTVPRHDFFASRNSLNPALAKSDLDAQQLASLRQIIDYGLNASDYLLNVLEPQLYRQGTA